MKRLSVIDIIVSIGALLLVVVALAPAVARLQRTPDDARCQSNMRRWGEALALYTSDYDRRYPTNRFKSGVMAMTAQAPLSPKQYDKDGNRIRFVYTLNWVEALYPYLISEAKKVDKDWESYLRCPKASTATFPSNSKTSAVTYVFNYNLLEFSPGIIRDQSKMMMMREIDRLVESSCRPTNNSTGSPTMYPMSPFLTKSDYMMRGAIINDKMHGQGSHILFTDGHVQYFSTDYFPTGNLTATDNWDVETGQWWNWVNKSAELNKQIAVTP